MIKNIAWSCFTIGFFVIIVAGWNWLFNTDSVNVVDLRGCVYPQYFGDKAQIENIMKMRGYSDDEIDYAFKCY